jgi:hypothetical protein
VTPDPPVFAVGESRTRLYITHDNITLDIGGATTIILRRFGPDLHQIGAEKAKVADE